MRVCSCCTCHLHSHTHLHSHVLTVIQVPWIVLITDYWSVTQDRSSRFQRPTGTPSVCSGNDQTITCHTVHMLTGQGYWACMSQSRPTAVNLPFRRTANHSPPPHSPPTVPFSAQPPVVVMATRSLPCDQCVQFDHQEPMKKLTHTHRIIATQPHLVSVKGTAPHFLNKRFIVDSCFYVCVFLDKKFTN